MRLKPVAVHRFVWPVARGVACAGAAALAGPAVLAQDAGGITIVPTFTAQEMVTNNRDLASTNPQADAVTTISPGIQVNSRAGRVQGSLSYTLNSLTYARAPDHNTVQNALNAALNAEVVERHAFVNAQASVSQQTISAFGTQSGGTGLANSNRTEVSTLSVSPTVRGNLGGLADFNGGLNWSTSSSGSTQLGDSTSYGGQFGLSGRSGVLGWGLNASRQGSSYKLGSTTATDQFGGSLSYAPRYDLNFGVNLGRARSDVVTSGQTWSQTTGWTANWQPTDRTNIALQAGRSYYGNSHSYAFTHRMARSVWSYIDTTAVSTPGPQNNAQPLTLYDLLYAICVSGGGNTAACDQTVRASIAQQGLSPGAVLATGFINSTLTVSRSQTLTTSYSGMRLTTTLSVFRNSTSALGAAAPGSGDLSQGAPVRQQGLTLGLSHRLTETASLSLTGTQQSTLASGTQPGNRQRLVNLIWSYSPGPRTSISLTARHSQFTSATSPYSESAVIGSFGYQFNRF